MKRNLMIGLVLLGVLLVLPLISQAPVSGSLWTYYLKNARYVWGRVDIEAPFQLDTSVTPPRLRVLLPVVSLIRETEDVYVVKDSDVGPLVFTLRQAPIPESLMVFVLGSKQQGAQAYTVAGQVVTFLAEYSPGPAAVVAFHYRY